MLVTVSGVKGQRRADLDGNQLHLTHGYTLSHMSLYKKYYGILDRCNNPKNIAYSDYGGRGIACEFDSVEEFISYVVDTLGECPEGHTLDRINNSEGYKRGNLRWASHSQQMRNRRWKVGASGYKWVSKIKKKWWGQYLLNGQRFYTPRMATPFEAYKEVLAMRLEQSPFP